MSKDVEVQVLSRAQDKKSQLLGIFSYLCEAQPYFFSRKNGELGVGNFASVDEQNIPNHKFHKPERVFIFVREASKLLCLREGI